MFLTKVIVIFCNIPVGHPSLIITLCLKLCRCNKLLKRTDVAFNRKASFYYIIERFHNVCQTHSMFPEDPLNLSCSFTTSIIQFKLDFMQYHCLSIDNLTSSINTNTDRKAVWWKKGPLRAVALVRILALVSTGNKNLWLAPEF